MKDRLTSRFSCRCETERETFYELGEKKNSHKMLLTAHICNVSSKDAHTRKKKKRSSDETTSTLKT